MYNFTYLLNIIVVPVHAYKLQFKHRYGKKNEYFIQMKTLLGIIRLTYILFSIFCFKFNTFELRLCTSIIIEQVLKIHFKLLAKAIKKKIIYLSHQVDLKFQYQRKIRHEESSLTSLSMGRQRQKTLLIKHKRQFKLVFCTI